MPEGYNTGGSVAWYEFTESAPFPLSPCLSPSASVGVVGNNSSTGFYGIAATPAGVNPDTPFGTESYVPWPKGGATYYMEVIGTGYFSVSIS